MTARGYFCVEARWEQGHEAPTFVVVDEIGGTLDEAKGIAHAYLNRHVAAHDNGIEWIEGIHRKAKCWFGYNHVVTFRISR